MLGRLTRLIVWVLGMLPPPANGKWVGDKIFFLAIPGKKKLGRFPYNKLEMNLAQILLFFTFASNFPLHPSHRRYQVTVTRWHVIKSWLVHSVLTLYSCLNISFLNLIWEDVSFANHHPNYCIYIYSISWSVAKHPSHGHSIDTKNKMSSICSLVVNRLKHRDVGYEVFRNLSRR